MTPEPDPTSTEEPRDESLEESSEEPADESPGESTESGSAVERRPLLKALGVGAALSLGSGLTDATATTATATTATATTAHEQDDSRMHPTYGYSVSDSAEIPGELRPDREVSLEVNPPDPEAGTPPSFFFEPAGLRADAGDIVQFTFATPDHTVTAYHPGTGFQRRVPENVPPFSSPVVSAGGAWLYRVERDGVYDVYCGPHHVFGMVMRIVVGDIGEDEIPDYEATFEGSEDPPLLAPYSREMLEGELNNFSDRNEDAEWVWPTPAEVLDADALDPTRIRDAGSVSFAEVRDELGRDATPTTTA